MKTSKFFLKQWLILIVGLSINACSKNSTTPSSSQNENNSQNFEITAGGDVTNSATSPGLGASSNISGSGSSTPNPSVGFGNMSVINPNNQVGDVFSDGATLCSSISECSHLAPISVPGVQIPSNKAIVIAHAGNATCTIPSTRNKGETDQAFKSRRLALFKQMPLYDGRLDATDPAPNAVNYFAKALRTLQGQDVPTSQISWLVSCFGYLPDLSIELNYVSSLDPTTVFTTTIDGMSDIVQSLSASSGPANVYIIGHSYGGTLAMLSANKLASNDAAHVSLITLDAIGFGCSLKKTDDPDCTRFPVNPSSATLRSKLTGTWENFYQLDAKMETFLGKYALHSNAVPGVVFVDPNIQDRIVWRRQSDNSVVTDVSAHINMMALPRAWDSLFAHIISDYPIKCDVRATDGSFMRSETCSSWQICGDNSSRASKSLLLYTRFKQ